MRFSSTALVLLLTIVTASSVVIDARVLTSLEISRIPTGPLGIWDRMGVVSGRLRDRPIHAWDREDAGLPGLGRYVFECTAPTDRLFVPWFAPQLFFYTERAFGGGQVYLRPNWHASLEDQRLTVERLERERVPIVIEAVKGDYPVYFPLVFEYIRKRYREVPLTSEKMEGFRVLVDRHLSPTGTYEPLKLPCYR